MNEINDFTISGDGAGISGKCCRAVVGLLEWVDSRHKGPIVIAITAQQQKQYTILLESLD